MTSSLHKFYRDHYLQKSNTSIKKRSPHQQHHISLLHQHALRRCRGRATIIFTPIPRCSCLVQRTIFIAGWPDPLASPAKSGKEFIWCTRARCHLISFFLNSYSCVNSDKFLCSSPTYCYLPLFFF